MRLPSADTSYGVPQWPWPIGGTLYPHGQPEYRDPSRLHRCHTLQLSLRIDEEQLGVVAAPDRLITAVAGNRNAFRRARDGTDRHFRPGPIPTTHTPPTGHRADIRASRSLKRSRPAAVAASRRRPWEPSTRRCADPARTLTSRSLGRPVGRLAVLAGAWQLTDDAGAVRGGDIQHPRARPERQVTVDIRQMRPSGDQTDSNPARRPWSPAQSAPRSRSSTQMSGVLRSSSTRSRARYRPSGERRGQFCASAFPDAADDGRFGRRPRGEFHPHTARSESRYTRTSAEALSIAG